MSDQAFGISARRAEMLGLGGDWGHWLKWGLDLGSHPGEGGLRLSGCWANGRRAESPSIGVSRFITRDKDWIGGVELGAMADCSSLLHQRAS